MKNENIIKNVYFIGLGDRVGQFIVMIDYNISDKAYSVLTLPELECLYINEDEIYKNIMEKKIDFVETLPDTVFNDCKNQFLLKETINN